MVAADKSGQYKDLIFSRQFLLGSKPFIYTDRWRVVQLAKGLVLSVHPQLELEIKKSGTETLALLGYLIDPFQPTATSADILEIIVKKTTSIHELLESTVHLSGRWALIYVGAKDSIIFTDPCGLRQVYYYVNNDGIWCGSQPEIIKAAAAGLKPNTDKALLAFMKSFDYQRKEFALVGNKTIYANCYHLLPNHFLDLNLASPIRFFPKKNLAPISTNQAVEMVSSLLQGGMRAIAQRYPVMLAVTAGWDTRVLLAATKGITDCFKYYVDRKGILPFNHPDVQIPLRLCRRLGINFEVRNSAEEPPSWFKEIISQSVSGARTLPKTRMIYSTFAQGTNSIVVNGNGSEVCRNSYDYFGLISSEDLTIAQLTGLIGYYKNKYVENELAKWKNELESNGQFGYHILDLLYWEQGMGNWGAQFVAEQDIATEDFSPFNNRLIYKTLLSLPRKYRSGPRFPIYAQLIEKMWPETLSEPINPKNFISSYLHFYFYRLPIPVWARLKLFRFVVKKFLNKIIKKL